MRGKKNWRINLSAQVKLFERVTSKTKYFSQENIILEQRIYYNLICAEKWRINVIVQVKIIK